ncbi:hypothetical protein HS088_TW14G00772 [Tripterygium wilfordii]|uniref:Uncharacterized protein n=1 Tax=Tripterygium wilfordii TaxID=458696 RepID=A0A7J7CRA0_TRIWF|nr:hypothetical protein HS088_TW14G00772 [Tripterygium wilfordii]
MEGDKGLEELGLRKGLGELGVGESVGDIDGERGGIGDEVAEEREEDGASLACLQRKGGCVTLRARKCMLLLVSDPDDRCVME